MPVNLPDTSTEIAESVESTGTVVDPNSLKFFRAVRDAEEAHSMCKSLVEENKDRNSRNALISRRYNDDQPFDPSALKNAGQDWRSNFSSGFLSTTIKRALPAYKKVVDTAKTLTSSELEDSSPESKEKSESFRMNITRVLRRWSGWNDLVTQIGLENLLYGYAAAIKTDELDWRPFFARQDEVFFPEGCGQTADRIPYFCYWQKFYLWELAEYLKNPNESMDAGWNVKNIVEELNAAKEDNRSSGTSEDARTYEDVVRENTQGATYAKSGMKVVDAYHLFIREPNGRVSHWIVAKESGKELFCRLDRFEMMSDCLSIFTIEVGNGKLHGSKGAGRLLYNRALAIERSRNIALDNLFLASLVIVKTTTEGKKQLAIEVAHPFMVLGENVEVVTQTFQVNEGAFRSLDNFSAQLAEQQIGSYTPSTALMESKGDETAAKVNYVASVEQQIRDGVLMRWWAYIQAMVYMMQRTICSPQNIAKAYEYHQALSANGAVKMARRVFEFLKKIALSITGQAPVVYDADSDAYDPEAIDCILRMLKDGLSPQQIFELATCPPQQTVEDLAQQNSGMIADLAAKYMNDPLADKLAIRRDDIASKLGYAASQRWFPSDIDQTVAVEQMRQQLEEYYLLLVGEDIPVSPRDVDKVHLQVLLNKGAQLVKMLQTAQGITPQDLTTLDNVLKHGEAHLQSAISKGATPDTLAEEIAFIQGARQVLSSVGVTPPEGALPQGQQMPTTPQDVATNVSPPNTELGQSMSLPAMPSSPIEASVTKPLSKSQMNLTPMPQ